MTYVYTLSDYEEDGAEHVTATLNRSRLMSMVDENWPFTEEHTVTEHQRKWHRNWLTEAKNGLEKHLQNADEYLAKNKNGWKCHSGWGGIQLHVIELVGGQ